MSARTLVLISTVCFYPLSAFAAPIHHELNVRLFPREHRIEATDTVTFAVPPRGTGITLNPALEQTVKWTTDRSFVVLYGGMINDPLQDVGPEHARGQRETAGRIGPEGVYLDGGSGWYPRFPQSGGEKMTFDLVVELPEGWDAVSQGTRAAHTLSAGRTVVRWTCEKPQDGIWLVAGRYSEYTRMVDGINAMAFFREPEETLAGKYLQATGTYIRMYERLIGPYPYGKFALVENFWETGYGMPSFTLLGPRVIRFPFIIETSYPHEILHNWWGNGVFVDYRSGNWGEGLTAYISDHLLQEQEGLGARYRKEVLQKYADYVLTGRDTPLSQFRSRHGSVSEAVGYGKGMMVFHMLRLKLGDERFREGLRRFYADNLFRTADFGDLQAAFERVSGRDLSRFFHQWVRRRGAPVLELVGQGDVAAEGERFRLRIVLKQIQEGAPYQMDVPVAVTLEGTGEAALLSVPMDSSVLSTTIRLKARPVRVDVDPAFDLFRRLDRREIPPALSQAFGAGNAVFVLPSRAPETLLASYNTLAQTLRSSGPGQVQVTSDSSLSGLPPGSSVWVLGWENDLLQQVLPALGAYGVRVDTGAGTVVLPDPDGTVLNRWEDSVVLTARHPLAPDLAVVWIAASDAAAHPGLARKLPHYHKYSYLSFKGAEPVNILKGRWPVTDSPLTGFPGGAYTPMGVLKERGPLVDRVAGMKPGG